MTHQWVVLAIGFVVSFFVAFVVVAWFMRWVRRRGFAPFAIYRILLGYCFCCLCVVCCEQLKWKEVILPDLQSAVICEDVRCEFNGMQTLVGVLSVIPAPTLPINYFRLCIWSRWCGGSVNTARNRGSLAWTSNRSSRRRKSSSS